MMSFVKWVQMGRTSVQGLVVDKEKAATQGLALKKEKAVSGDILHLILFFAGGMVFAYQLYCGVVFFTRLLLGETYFMMG